MLLRFKTKEELEASGWELQDLALVPCWRHKYDMSQPPFTELLVRRSGVTQDNMLQAWERGRWTSDDFQWVVTSEMLTLVEPLQKADHECEAVNVSLFFTVMACKVCGRDM